MEVFEGEGGKAAGQQGSGVEAVVGRAAVSEELIWKDRAEELERRLGEARDELGALRLELERANRALSESETRRRIERELVDADALDLEACCLLTEAAVSQMDEPDVSLAVRDLRRRKPYLFQGRASAVRGATMTPIDTSVEDELGLSAERARTSGDRAALLRYLRQRRG